MAPFKWCRRCRLEKPRDQFRKNCRVKDGLFTYCRPCEYYFQQENKHGLTQGQYQNLVEKQGNKCAICRTPAETMRKRISVDHCHKTGAVRGLLCENCNMGLGKFKDSPELLHSAADYLEKATNE